MRKRLLFVLIAIGCVSLTALAQEKKDEFPKTKISGLIFGDYYYNAVRDSAFSPKKSTNLMTGNNSAFGKQDENSVQLKRILFAFEHKATKNVEALFRLEADPTTSYNTFAYDLATNKNSVTYGRFSTFVKDAYMKWNYFKGHTLQFGLFTTGAWDVSEGYWGHRFSERTITDLRKSTSARDFGVGLNGKIDSLGKFKYSVMFGEGTGVNVPIADTYKRYYASFQYSPILELNDKKEVAKELTVNIYADYKEQASKVNPYYVADGSRGTGNYKGNQLNITLFAGYKVKDKYTFGVECYYNNEPKAYNFVDATTPLNSKLMDKNGMGVSVFGSYQIMEKVGAFARFDYYEPNMESSNGAKSDQRNFIALGGTYSPAKNFTISPNVLVETYENKIDGITNADGSKKNQPFKSSITPRVSFFYAFK